MKKIIKRGCNLRHFMVIFGLVLIFIGVNAQKVSAEEQKENPYLIKVNRVYNTITVYEKDEDGAYSQPVIAMACSVGKKGTETKLGTFQTKEKFRWKELMGKVYGQYSTRIVGGILFHSVYYYENGNPATLATREYNNLGSAASHGCIRLNVEDAKWIFDNCPIGTTVVIYDDKESPGPLGKPETIKLSSNVRWDPTDPSASNPFAEKKPSISGTKNISITWGDSEFDLLKGVKAKSSVGTDISSDIIVTGEVNPYMAGKYKVTYAVEDILGRISKKTVTVSVKKSAEAPVFVGVGDRVIKEATLVDEDFALNGIKAYCSDVMFDQSDIEVTIENVAEEEYLVTYFINIGMNVTATETATFYIDKEVPVFTGIEERILDPGQIPDQELALSGVAVTDNYTELDVSDINVTIDESADGSFLVTYAAVDEVGNEAKESVIYHY